jgi:drug/metabolite transporter (DMT)-like permease
MTTMKSLSVVQKAFLALIIANIIWGAAAAIFKLSLQNIPPFTLAFWRFFLGAILIFIVMGKKVSLPLESRRDGVLLFLYGFFGITVNIIFFFLGLQRTFSINSPVISSAQPILTLFFALLFLHESFRLKKFVGMVFGTLGILVIIIEPLLTHGVDGSIIGNLFLVFATVAAVLQTIVGKKIINKYNPWAFTFWAFLVGAASFLPLALYEYAKIPHLYAMLDWRGYTGIAFGAIFSSTIGYGLFAWGLSKISATDSAMFAYVDPIVGTIAGALILREPITVPFLLGSLLIFGGIFLAEGRIHYHPIRKLILMGKSMEHATVPIVFQTPVPPHAKLKKKEVLASIFKKNE